MSHYEEALSEEKQQELMDKYDPEAGTRKLKGIIGWIAFAGLLAFSLFHLYTGIFGMLNGTASAFDSFRLCTCTYFFTFSSTRKNRGKEHKVAWYDINTC